MPRIPALPSYKQPEGAKHGEHGICVFSIGGVQDFRIVSLFFLVCLCEKDRFGKVSVIGCGQHGGAVDDQKFWHDCSPSMII